jgi:hypothetical protein
MKVAIKFPNDAEAIAEDVARFRALSPERRVQTLGEMFRLYHFLASNAAQPEAVARFAQEEEERGRKAVEEFIARHG